MRKGQRGPEGDAPGRQASAKTEGTEAGGSRASKQRDVREGRQSNAVGNDLSGELAEGQKSK